MRKAGAPVVSKWTTVRHACRFASVVGKKRTSLSIHFLEKSTGKPLATAGALAKWSPTRAPTFCLVMKWNFSPPPSLLLLTFFRNQRDREIAPSLLLPTPFHQSGPFSLPPPPPAFYPSPLRRRYGAGAFRSLPPRTCRLIGAPLLLCKHIRPVLHPLKKGKGSFLHGGPIWEERRRVCSRPLGPSSSRFLMDTDALSSHGLCFFALFSILF